MNLEQQEVISEMLEKDMCTPENVVAHARNRESPLHSLIEWNDRSAGKKYRLVQAADIIRRYRVVIETPAGAGATVTVRGAVSLLSDRQAGTGIRRSIYKILEDDDQRAELLRTAYAELRAFRSKYAALSELTGLIGAIGAVVDPQQPSQRVAGDG